MRPLKNIRLFIRLSHRRWNQISWSAFTIQRHHKSIVIHLHSYLKTNWIEENFSFDVVLLEDVLPTPSDTNVWLLWSVHLGGHQWHSASVSHNGHQAKYVIHCCKIDNWIPPAKKVWSVIFRWSINILPLELYLTFIVSIAYKFDRSDNFSLQLPLRASEEHWNSIDGPCWVKPHMKANGSLCVTCSLQRTATIQANWWFILVLKCHFMAWLYDRNISALYGSSGSLVLNNNVIWNADWSQAMGCFCASI